MENQSFKIMSFEWKKLTVTVLLTLALELGVPGIPPGIFMVLLELADGDAVSTATVWFNILLSVKIRFDGEDDELLLVLKVETEGVCCCCCCCC